MAIEIDGSSHDYKYFYDAKRQGRLENYDVTFLRFTNEEIRCNLFSVLSVIEEKVKELSG